jgi:hypothetical protein
MRGENAPTGNCKISCAASLSGIGDARGKWGDCPASAQLTNAALLCDYTHGTSRLAINAQAYARKRENDADGSI